MRSLWLVSRRTYNLFLYSSWTVVYLGTFMLFMSTPYFQRVESMTHGDIVLKMLAIPLAILGAPAALFILFGMAIFCVRMDRSSVGTKVSWFLLFFFTAPFGSALYFFLVYKKQAKIVPVPPTNHEIMAPRI
jgi:hypothetical protein